MTNPKSLMVLILEPLARALPLWYHSICNDDEIRPRGVTVIEGKRRKKKKKKKKTRVGLMT
jgi:hypothetical protein